MSEPPEVVILGAGYAGLRAALDLARAVDGGDVAARVTLVDRGDRHEVVTLLHQVATEACPQERAVLKLAELLPASVRRVAAGVEGLDVAARRVATSAGPLDYDRLVVALGSVPSAPPIDGLGEHAFRLRRYDDALRLRRHVRRQFALAGRAADFDERRARLRFVVVGGGATGCQLMGELAHWVTELADRYRTPLGEIDLLLLEAGNRLLPGWADEVARGAALVLRRKAVGVRLGHQVDAVAADSVTFAGRSVATRTVVWTGGVRAPALLAEAGLATGSLGRVKTDRYLRAAGHPEIHVAGDAALFEHQGKALPATAAFALRQGAYVAESLAGVLAGREADPYRPRDLGMLVSLGGSDAVGDLLGVPFAGLPGGVAKEGIERGYVAGVLLNAWRTG